MSICCMAPGCDKVGTVRGLCVTHAAIAAKQVRDGITTWDELIEKGQAKPVIKPEQRRF